MRVGMAGPRDGRREVGTGGPHHFLPRGQMPRERQPALPLKYTPARSADKHLPEAHWRKASIVSPAVLASTRARSSPVSSSSPWAIPVAMSCSCSRLGNSCSKTMNCFSITGGRVTTGARITMNVRVCLPRETFLRLVGLNGEARKASRDQFKEPSGERGGRWLGGSGLSGSRRVLGLVHGCL